MNKQKMLLISPKKVEFHPDFRATLVSNWRFRSERRPSQDDMMASAAELMDEEGIWDPKEAFEIVMTQVEKDALQDCVSQFSKLFWNAYRAQVVADAESKKKIKTTPPNGSNTTLNR